MKTTIDAVQELSQKTFVASDAIRVFLSLS